jgi:hypothetical protein
MFAWGGKAAGLAAFSFKFIVIDADCLTHGVRPVPNVFKATNLWLR